MIAIYKNQPVTEQDLGLWQGDIVTLLPECKEPKLRWTGAPIPAKFFGQMLGFFRHAHKTWHSEAMVRLAYNKAERQWRMVCYPQTIKQGMEVKEIKELNVEQKAIRDAASASLGEGYHECGSSHSHCDAAAFQSGTDLANELKNTGVHITLGRINSDRPHVHGRVSFRGIIYPINWAEWFEGWPEDMDGKVDTFDLMPGGDLSFPEEWLKSCFEPPPVTSYFPAYTPSRFTPSKTTYSNKFKSTYGFGSSMWDDDSYDDSEFNYGHSRNDRTTETDSSIQLYSDAIDLREIKSLEDINETVGLILKRFLVLEQDSVDEMVAPVVVKGLLGDDMHFAQECLDALHDNELYGYIDSILDYIEDEVQKAIHLVESLASSDLPAASVLELVGIAEKLISEDNQPA